jgi:hypothetical protein
VFIRDEIVGEKVPWRPYVGRVERDVDEEGMAVNFVDVIVRSWCRINHEANYTHLAL